MMVIKFGTRCTSATGAEEEEAADEVARRDSESTLDVREEDDGLAGPLRRELVARDRAPADFRLGP
jgi:hypothetical protein